MSQLFNLKNPVHLLATGFGSGLITPAPGTWGTLAALFIYQLGLVHLSLVAFWLVVAVASVAGICICGKAATDSGSHDHGSIVWDEFAGFWLGLGIATIFTGGHLHLYWVIAGFIYFRLFDIVKPFPINWLDKRVPGGFGIMLDDLIAGIFAGAALYGSIALYAKYLGIN